MKRFLSERVSSVDIEISILEPRYFSINKRMYLESGNKAGLSMPMFRL